MTTPTRAAGLDALRAFVPHAGADYRRDRNHDTGPARTNVSGLSPYIRHRLVTEQEVVDAVLERHSLHTAEKFVQEVFWRTYWKGWLEQRPEVWRRYREEVRDLLAGDLPAHYEDVVAGRSGIEAMDAWVRELVETGYLHNHTRMWFASIWVFTLELPWQLGADFFSRHLLDGDAASNTLSWRWVAGLQTRGKTYLATTENIARYTDGRFAPTGLATEARALDEEPFPAAVPVPSTTSTAASASASGCCCTRRTWSPRACSRSTRPSLRRSAQPPWPRTPRSAPPPRCRPRSRPSPPVRSRTLRRGAPVRPCSTRSSPPPSSAGQARRTWTRWSFPMRPSALSGSAWTCCAHDSARRASRS